MANSRDSGSVESDALRVVGVGGSLSAGSTSLRALAHCLDGAAAAGATTQPFDIRKLALPTRRHGGRDMTAGLDVDIVDEPQRSRYVACFDGELAGFAEYVLEAGRITFTHTVVTDRFEGRGVGSRLAAGVLDDARARHLWVEPQCPFIAAFIDGHIEYSDLVEQA